MNKTSSSKKRIPTSTQAQRKTYYKAHEQVFSEDMKQMAREGRFGEMVQEFTAYGRFLERHPEAMA